jgi:hypothetical protein
MCQSCEQHTLNAMSGSYAMSCLACMTRLMLKAPSKDHRSALAYLAERSLTRTRKAGHYSMDDLRESVKASLDSRSHTQKNTENLHD